MMEELDLICTWWGQTIALAVDGDDESRHELVASTGDPNAVAKLAHIRMDDAHADPAIGWAEFLRAVVADPDDVEQKRPAPGDPGYDPVLGAAAELAVRLARGIRADRPEALPR